MKTLTIDVNGACNLECEFCYQELDGSQLSREEILKIVKEKPDFGIVEIGGGEPSLHPGLADIIEGIVNEGRKVHVSTNGVIIPEKLLSLDKGTRSRVALQVSLPAGRRETYKEITGKDFFDAAVSNAGILREHYDAVLSTAVYQKNYQEIEDILQISYDLGIPARINLVFPVGKGKDVSLLANEQIDRLKGLLLVEKINNKMVDSPLIHGINCPALSRAYGFQSTEGCPLTHGTKEYVNPRGAALGCEFYHKNKGKEDK